MYCIQNIVQDVLPNRLNYVLFQISKLHEIFNKILYKVNKRSNINFNAHSNNYKGNNNIHYFLKFKILLNFIKVPVNQKPN